ncbi:hypothetical protein H4582DRAFT_1982946 [Lactarius indigo]|nr:hypothetical protein H4582DRAFT_1982946 [Lactarius indigo]
MASTTRWKPDILIDGYIANTLLPQGTEHYLSHFINCLEQEPGAAIVPYASGWIVQRSAPPQTTTAHIHTRRSRRPKQHRELFDCQVNLDTGTIVPQPTQTRPCKLTGLLSPNLSASKFLYNATAEVPSLLRRPNLNARIRILWPGYKTFHYEFRIFDRKLGKDVPITMSRLVERIARGLHRLYLEGVRNPETFDERWKLGEGGVLLEEIKIIGLLHVSQGTWIPMLHLTRHIFPRYCHGTISSIFPQEHVT